MVHLFLICVGRVYACIWVSWSWAMALVRAGSVVLRTRYRRACLYVVAVVSIEHSSPIGHVSVGGDVRVV
jgi:hypothetical protein